MEKNLTFVLILLLSTICNTFASDIDTLYKRYWDLSINNPSKESIDEMLALLLNIYRKQILETVWIL